MADYSSSPYPLHEKLAINDVNHILENNNNDNDNDNNLIDNYLLALHAIQASFLPMVLHAAIELNVFNILAKSGHGNGLTVNEISGQLAGCRNPDASMLLDRMLRLLSTHEMVKCTIRSSNLDGQSKVRYGLSPVSRFFVGDENGLGLGSLLALYIDPAIQTSWSQLKDAVLEGGVPFNKVHGMHAYEYPKFNPRFNQVFNEAMFNQPSLTMVEMIEKYNIFQGINKLVDVGGGLGHTLRIILSKYPSIIQAFNFDLPSVIADAPPYPGVQHIGGDMFESVPEGDAILMKWVLQVWDDEDCIKVLRNCYKSIANENGKVIIMEELISENHDEVTIVSKVSTQIDAYLMIKNPGGRLRSLKEYANLANLAGFQGIKLIGNVAELSVIQLFKH